MRVVGFELWIQIDEVRLPVMQRLLRPRSRSFRCLLMLALLAWTAFALDAMAHPLAMVGGMGHAAGMVMGQATPSHCEGMPLPDAATSTPAPAYPIGSGHGCCAFGHCLCAAFCSGIAGVPRLDMTWVPPHAPGLVPIDAPPALARSVPPLRPPIA